MIIGPQHDEGYSDSPPSVQRQYFHPHLSYFQPNYPNMWLEGSFSFCPSCGFSGSTLDVVSSIFPWCGHQCCNDCNGCKYIYFLLHWLMSSYLFPFSTSSFPPWKLPGVLSSSNHLATPFFGLCFPGIVLVHKPHPLS
jgi:hypothetical protein